MNFKGFHYLRGESQVEVCQQSWCLTRFKAHKGLVCSFKSGHLWPWETPATSYHFGSPLLRFLLVTLEDGLDLFSKFLSLGPIGFLVSFDTGHFYFRVIVIFYISRMWKVSMQFSGIRFGLCQCYHLVEAHIPVSLLLT